MTSYEYEVNFLRRIRNIIIDIEILENETTLKRVKKFLHVATKLRPTGVKIFIPEELSNEQESLIYKFGFSQKDIVIRPKNLYQRYSLIYKVFRIDNPSWLDCRKVLYLNYFEYNNPIHIPNEKHVYPSLDAIPKDVQEIPIICPLRKLYTCNIVRNCINNCIYCFVPDTGAPRLPLVICINMPEKIREQIKRMKKPYITTDFGSITDPCNPLIDNVFKIFRESFSVLKEYEYPALILTKSNPSREILNTLTYDNALLAFSFYHLDPHIKRKWELNSPSPQEVLHSIQEAKKLGVRLAFRIDIFPGYNDDISILKKIVKVGSYYNIEHITAGSLRARYSTLKRIKMLNPQAYSTILSSLDKKKYSDGLKRPIKQLREVWYSQLSRSCSEKGIPFALCKEEADLIQKFSQGPCLCQWVTWKD